MNRYFSSRGAKRGLILAALTLLVWCCWAVGYWQGVEGATSTLTLWILF
jgi:hypothetical protein